VSHAASALRSTIVGFRLWVWGLGFGDWGSWFEVGYMGLGFSVWGLRLAISGLKIGFRCLLFRD
jgi:hypothetical protein